MSYKSSRYKQGLSGKKPSWIHFDEEGHGAQEAGYRDHLANEDLVQKLREDRRERSSDNSYSSEPEGPLTRGQRIFWGVVFFGGGLCLSIGMYESYQMHPGTGPDLPGLIVPVIINLILYYSGLCFLLKRPKQ